MVTTLRKPEFEELRPGIKAPAKETILTPRFYTTDFDEVAKMDISPNEEELRAILEEFRVDYNRHHFVRDEDFEQSWEHIDGEKRRLFMEFLERSCTAEFSGFLLYKELGRRLKTTSPLLAECFNLMSRDEARHAGFLNKAMSDFDLSLDLGFLTKSRKYTFFKPKFIFYATYLSEKIGYWRYITIYRHLEKHPEDRVYPIFKFFENWCQDENRHGDFFKALLRSQPNLWKTWQSRLWARFFLLTVFVTHTLTVFERSDFYKSIGMNARQYNVDVVRHTNETAARAFPEVLDTNHPQFFDRLEICSQANEKLTAIAQNNQPKVIKFFQKLPWISQIVWNMLLIFVQKPINAEALRGQVH
jgi:magnesium-protoporphyrin IX monomethyl ester (oxidative) cyclase